MRLNRTFGQKIAAGFAVVALLGVVTGIVAIRALRDVVESKDEVIARSMNVLIDARGLDAAFDRMALGARGFIISPQERFLERLSEAKRSFAESLERIEGGLDPEGVAALSEIERGAQAYRQALDELIEMRRAGASLEAISDVFDERITPQRDQVGLQLSRFVERQTGILDQRKQSATDAASAAVRFVTGTVGALMLFALAISLLLTRTLARQIGTAVAQVQSSSAELQAAATQQATGAKEQATAMNEIATTIGELLATSQQIAESAQRVAQIAEDTSKSAGTGGSTVGRASESVTGIRRQVDVIVSHMLELGRKSQEIGSVLEIVSELAEQTNILAINATIEASGAGEAGRRFGVVAEEIRKLADRVGGATKEIRGLIEDVRGAVNTTVMATESGSKAVDAGARQFADVSSAFQQIAELVLTTTEAAREIELSTKQQATAVEQVNVAIANISQATRETEASSNQTLQTASQLSSLSHDLVRIVAPQASG